MVLYNANEISLLRHLKSSFPQFLASTTIRLFEHFLYLWKSNHSTTSSLTSFVSRFLAPSFALFPAPTFGPYPTFQKYVDRSEDGNSKSLPKEEFFRRQAQVRNFVIGRHEGFSTVRRGHSP
jgi:hypothetical protein